MLEEDGHVEGQLVAETFGYVDQTGLPVYVSCQHVARQRVKRFAIGTDFSIKTDAVQMNLFRLCHYIHIFQSHISVQMFKVHSLQISLCIQGHILALEVMRESKLVGLEGFQQKVQVDVFRRRVRVGQSSMSLQILVIDFCRAFYMSRGALRVEPDVLVVVIIIINIVYVACHLPSREGFQLVQVHGHVECKRSGAPQGGVLQFAQMDAVAVDGSHEPVLSIKGEVIAYITQARHEVSVGKQVAPRSVMQFSAESHVIHSREQSFLLMFGHKDINQRQ